jgi:hypothetical protein
MLPLEFLGQDLHFAISLFAALVFFAVFWLYFDAWLEERKNKEIFKWAGFLLIALSFLVYSTIIEKSLLNRSLLGNVSETLSQILLVAGFLSVLISELVDPLQEKPKTKGIRSNLVAEEKAEAKAETKPAKPKRAAKSSRSSAVGGFGALANPLHFLPPLGALAIGLMYFRRATVGLEHHLKPVAIAFFLLFGFEFLSLGSLWSDSSNPALAKLVASFGPVWIAATVFLLASAVVLSRWVWQYLTERFMSQLFMVFISMVMAIFLVTTICFTYLLVNSFQQSSLSNLNTAASVLKYAINTKKAETLADSQTVAENPAVTAAVIADDHNQLTSLTSSFLYSRGVSSLIITNDNAEVLLRAENPDRYGDSLSSDTLIRRALVGQSASSVSTQSGVLAPVMYIRSAAPIRDAQQQIIGAAVVSFAIDNAFVDGIKQSTGLDSSLYAGNVVSATTLRAPDGVTRWTGVKETGHAVLQTVLTKGQTYKGTVSSLNQQYLAVFLPLKNVDNSVVGMLFIGQPSLDILKTAGHSVELTFLVAALLLIVSVVPAYVMARHIAKQLE